MLDQNEAMAWEFIYDKYAPCMYGEILKLVPDEKLASKILVETFIHLKEEKGVFKNIKSLYPTLLRHTYINTVKYVGAIAIIPIMNGLLHKSRSLKTP